MRKMLYAVGCLLFFAPLQMRAENVVEVSTKDGRTVYFRLSERPYAVIRNNGEVLIESWTELERSVSFLISKGLKMRVCDVDLTGIRTTGKDAASVFRLLPDRLEVSGLGASAPVALYASDGRRVYAGHTGSDGSLTVGLSSFAGGTYVVKAGSVTCKIIKQ